MSCEFGEQIRVTIRPGGGVAFFNRDAIRRLAELGIRKNPSRGFLRSPRSLTQQTALERYPQIRDLEHYRELVGDPRSNGPIFWFNPGQVLLMERMLHPQSKNPYYAILDTAIFCRPEFLEYLKKKRRITIEAFS